MKLVQGVVRSLAVGLSPSCGGLSIARSLATSSASAVEVDGIASSLENLDDSERRILGDLCGNSQSSDRLYRTLDQIQNSRDRSVSGSKYGTSRYWFSDGPSDSLTDGMGRKLKEAATYFEFDADEVRKDDYKFRPDVTFWSGNTYDVKDLDPRIPAVRKQAKRFEFEVTTEEVLRKADFRNVRFLANFITEAGIIVKRSKTKISAKAQRKVAREIKTARAFGLLPFTTMGTKQFVFGKTMEELDTDYEYETYDHNFVDTDAS